MEWIFLGFGVATLVLLAAQLRDYIVQSVQSSRQPRVRPHVPAFVGDAPPAAGRSSADITVWFDEAA